MYVNLQSDAFACTVWALYMVCWCHQHCAFNILSGVILSGSCSTVTSVVKVFYLVFYHRLSVELIYIHSYIWQENKMTNCRGCTNACWLFRHRRVTLTAKMLPSPFIHSPVICEQEARQKVVKAPFWSCAQWHTAAWKVILEKILSQGSHSLWTWRSLKVWGKWDKLFKALKVCENWVGSVKVCEFCGLQSTRGKLWAYQSETAFPKTEQQFKQKTLPCKIKKNALPISYSKGCTPLLDVWKSCVPACCFSMPCCQGLWRVCEFWKDFSVRTL